MVHARLVASGVSRVFSLIFAGIACPDAVRIIIFQVDLVHACLISFLCPDVFVPFS